MATRQLALYSDGISGEFRLEAVYQPDLTADPSGKAIDYYDGWYTTNTTAKPGAVLVVRRDTEQVVFTQPIAANSPRTFTDVTTLGTPAQRRRFDIRPQYPA